MLSSLISFDEVRTGVSLVDDVVLGCVGPVNDQGFNIAKAGIMYANWHSNVGGMQINRYCASGLEAIAMAVSKIKAGMGQIYIAGGTESMSLIPMTGYKLSPSYKANLENLNYHL